jgi:hypothetical protein
MKKQWVSYDKWRDGVKFLMNLGTNPSLTLKDQNQLRDLLKDPFGNGVFDASQTGLTADGARAALTRIWKTRS